MTRLAHKTPCKPCPFRRSSASGWLGGATPEAFLSQTMAEVCMPCHLAVDYDALDYEDPASKAVFLEASHCAGSLIFMRNACMLPRDKELREMRKQVQPDHETVFSQPTEFLQHHKKMTDWSPT